MGGIYIRTLDMPLIWECIRTNSDMNELSKFAGGNSWSRKEVVSATILTMFWVTSCYTIWENSKKEKGNEGRRNGAFVWDSFA